MLIGAGLLLRRAKLQVKQAKQTRAQRVVVAADATRRNALAAAVLAVPLLLAVPQPAKAGLVRWAAAGQGGRPGWAGASRRGSVEEPPAAESCTGTGKSARRLPPAVAHAWPCIRQRTWMHSATLRAESGSVLRRWRIWWPSLRPTRPCTTSSAWPPPTPTLPAAGEGGGAAALVCVRAAGAGLQHGGRAGPAEGMGRITQGPYHRRVPVEEGAIGRRAEAPACRQAYGA